ncbi:MAG: bile acid:sodium symporter family protein [Planctomycetaceae bacterium]
MMRTLAAPLAVVRRNLIWFLLVTYGVAVLLPDAGNELRQLQLGVLPFSGEPLTPTHLLLGVLLFCVGVAIRSEESRNLWRLTRSVTTGLFGSWLLPPLTLAAFSWCGSLIWSGGEWQSFLAGAILVTAMPPANSSSIWSELCGGQTAATVSVIILGTLLSPLTMPAVVGLFGLFSSTAGVDISLSTASLLEVLFAFVMLPAALGIATRAVLDASLPTSVPALMDASRFASLISLLLLNYLNAAAALPELVQGPQSPAAAGVAALTITLCSLVFAVAIVVSRRVARPEAAQRLPFVYVTGMKNTGAALVLAGLLFPAWPLVALVPVVYTLTQHFAAALIDRVSTTPRVIGSDLAISSELGQASTPSY